MPKASNTFEKAMKELEEITTKLERSDIALDDAISLYRKGQELYKFCEQKIANAQLEVEKLDANESPSESQNTTNSLNDK